MDYCTVRKTSSPSSLTVLLTKDRGSKVPMANGVLCKGRSHEDTVHQAASNVKRLGHSHKILVKTDGEPALLDLRRAVMSKLGIQAAPENSEPYAPQSNGAIECGVKQFKGMLRTLNLALEDRIKAEIPVTHPIMLWMVEHATELLAKYLVGKDGKTPYERLMGKRYRIEAFEFGEQVSYKKRVAEMADPGSGPASAGTPRGKRSESVAWMPSGPGGCGWASAVEQPRI